MSGWHELVQDVVIINKKWQDDVFWQVTRNTFVYTSVATALKMVGGLAMTLVMHQQFRGRRYWARCRSRSFTRSSWSTTWPA